MSLLTQIAVDAARERHPRIKLVFEALDAAEEVRAPEFSLAGFEAQRLERDRDLDVEASLVNDAFRLHQQIDAEVFAASFGENAVALNAERIEEHFKGLALVVESVEEEADVIVLKDVVALRDRRAHLVGLVGRFESDVEKLGIVTEQDFRRLRRRDVIARLNLI